MLFVIRGFVSLLLLFSISACGEYYDIPEMSYQVTEAHKQMLNRLVSMDSICRVAGAGRPHLVCSKTRVHRRQAKKMSDWKGKWFYTAQWQDTNLGDETKVYAGVLNRNSGIVEKGKSYDKASFEPEQIIQAGFFSLNENSGEIILANYSNKKKELMNFKERHRKLKWQVDMLDSTYNFIGSYDPSTDIMYGKAKSELGSFLWRATRIPESTYKRLTVLGIVNPNMPIYIISKDTNTED